MHAIGMRMGLYGVGIRSSCIIIGHIIIAAACIIMEIISKNVLYFDSSSRRENMANIDGMKQRQFVSIAPLTTSNDGNMMNISITNPNVWILSMANTWKND